MVEVNGKRIEVDILNQPQVGTWFGFRALALGICAVDNNTEDISSNESCLCVCSQIYKEVDKEPIRHLLCL